MSARPTRVSPSAEEARLDDVKDPPDWPSTALVRQAGTNGGPASLDPSDTARRARYSWAAKAVEGKEVLEVGRGGGLGVEILGSAGAANVTSVETDPRDLGLPDGSFDVVVCFEAIGQMDDCEPALGELRRVLRPDGLLFIASPDVGAQPAGANGNPDIHEHRPTELAALVGERFANVRSFRQPARAAYTIVAASDNDLPSLPGLRAGESLSATESELRRAVAYATESEAAVRARLRETGAGLVKANQTIAQLLVERSRLQTHIEILEESRSWRYMNPLRRLRNALRLRR